VNPSLIGAAQVALGLGCIGGSAYFAWVFIAKMRSDTERQVCPSCGLSYPGRHRSCPHCRSTPCWNCGFVWDRAHGCPNCGAAFEEPEQS